MIASKSRLWPWKAKSLSSCILVLMLFINFIANGQNIYLLMGGGYIEMPVSIQLCQYSKDSLIKSNFVCLYKDTLTTIPTGDGTAFLFSLNYPNLKEKGYRTDFLLITLNNNETIRLNPSNLKNKVIEISIGYNNHYKDQSGKLFDTKEFLDIPEDELANFIIIHDKLFHLSLEFSSFGKLRKYIKRKIKFGSYHQLI